jgi:hypothetical protein
MTAQEAVKIAARLGVESIGECPPGTQLVYGLCEKQISCKECWARFWRGGYKKVPYTIPGEVSNG